MTHIRQLFRLKNLSEFLNTNINWIYKNRHIDYNISQQLQIFITLQQVSNATNLYKYFYDKETFLKTYVILFF